MNTQPTNNNTADDDTAAADATDRCLDALLAARPLTPRTDFAADVLRAVAADTALDTLIDERLHHPAIAATPARTERFLHAVLQWHRRRQIIRFTLPALAAAAAIATFAAIAIFQKTQFQTAPEDTAPTIASAAIAPPSELPATTQDPLLAKALADDPALATFLARAEEDADADPAALLASLDPDTADTLAGLNDNTLDWLENLTLYAP
jgi:hypothetical protein